MGQQKRQNCQAAEPYREAQAHDAHGPMGSRLRAYHKGEARDVVMLGH